jgi:hypothetical protein
MRRIVLIAFGSLFAACGAHVKPVLTSDAARIWVVEMPGSGDEEIYRCADGAGPTDVPKPVCVKATLVSAP